MGKYFIILGTQSLKGTSLFLFSLFMDYSEIARSLLCILQMGVESGFIQNGYFLCVFGLGFWGFGFALAMLVCLWVLWCWVCVRIAFLSNIYVLCLIKNYPTYICINSKLKA